MKSSVLLIGAGGALGEPLVQEFSKHLQKFSRVAILTSEAKAHKFEKARRLGFETAIGSFLDSEPYEGFDTVVSLVGNSIMRLQPTMIDQAIAAGVRHFVPSEWNSDISQPELMRMRYFRDKHVTRNHLRAKAREIPDFKYTLFITGIFTEWSIGPFYGVDTVHHKVETYGHPDALIGVTSIPDVCKYTVEAFLTPMDSWTGEREVRVCGETLTWKHLVDALGKAQGAEYSHKYLDPSEAKQKEMEARQREDELDEMMWSIKPLAASGFGRVPGRVDNGAFSFKPETATQTFRRVYGDQDAA